MNRFPISLILITVVSLVGCVKISDPAVEKYNYSLLGELCVNEKHQKLYLFTSVFPNSKVNRPSIPEYYYPDLIAENAKIIISDGVNSWRDFDLLTFISPLNDLEYKKYYTNKFNMNLRFNQKYSISINICDQTIFAETTTPGNFSFCDFEYVNYLNVENSKLIKLKWTKSLNASYYKVFTKIFYGLNNRNIVNEYEQVLFDTTSFDFKFLSFYDSVQVKVKAFDKNSFDFNYKDCEVVNIKGAYGYLGASVQKQIVFINYNLK